MEETYTLAGRCINIEDRTCPTLLFEGGQTGLDLQRGYTIP
jgi:hypothetical protein